MSADLFAEFNQPAKRPQLQPQPQSQSAAYQSSANTTSQSSNRIDFSSSFSSNLPPATQQWTPAPQQWPFSPPLVPASIQPTAPAQPQIQNIAEDDDGWGDFEVAEETTSKASPIPPKTQQIQEPTFESIAWPGTASVASPQTTNKLFSNKAQSALLEFDDAEPPPKSKHKNVVRSKATDPNVLFDAADFELEDGEFKEETDEDFGDFEFASPNLRSSGQSKPLNAAPQQPAPTPSIDLLSLDDSIPVQSQRSQPHIQYNNSGLLQLESETSSTLETIKSPLQKMNFGTQSNHLKPASAKSQLKTTSRATVTNNDDWGDWDEMPSVNTIGSTEAPFSWSSNMKEVGASDANASDSLPPPINVPPPSILLSLFPELLSQGSALFKTASGTHSSAKNQILSNPKATQFLQGYILLATTAARIMAGRKQRWHRDKILAKSMSISAAGSKGMKLAGVDKTQVVREDREAADVMAAWREQVGRLRSAVTAANASSQTKLKVPELSESLSAHTAKSVVTAPKPCVICGLKRDERITKVDFEVEDSFGEWWVEHWGHRACKNFWTEHEKSLRQR